MLQFRSKTNFYRLVVEALIELVPSVEFSSLDFMSLKLVGP